MANNTFRDPLGLAQPKSRPRNFFDGFNNRKSVSKKAPQEQQRVSRESRSVYESSSFGISVNEQLRYLQKQHQELIEEHKTLKQDYRELQHRHDKLETEYLTLEEDYNALRVDFKNLEESQKTFNVRKILQLKFKKRADKETLVKQNIIQNEACFNTFLEAVVKSDPLGIPKIVVECVTIVESSDKFMKSQGLYRVSGNHNTIQNLRYDINADNYKKLRKQKTPHEVCGVLKLFLRELKEPIISLALLNRIIPGPSDMIHLRTIKVLELVNSLDELRKNTLQFLMQHLKKVAAVEDNEMDSTSLGILMSSCIFNETLSDVCPQRFEAISAVPRECTRTMIECYDEIFVK
ncbi:rho GTPase-activating protein 15 isoform X1 [Aedes aegypti]|uniref:Rho-GAP domain-containing protein n=1 Tax=Aedes aegypti TaxID=7159 RepID=A0A903V733_AEDAE|nr:rho GTPase-activating protein 15 isoform X1 [Aedes aegypti]